MSSARRRPSWLDQVGIPLRLSLVWGLLPFAALSAAFVARPSPPHDYWWPLVQGRLVSWGGAVPLVDSYLYSLPADTPFVNQQWLAHWLLYMCFRHGGYAAVALLASAVCLLAWAMLLELSLARSGNAVAASIAATIGVVFASPMLVPRAQTLVFPLFVLTLVITTGVADKHLRVRSLFWLVPITAVWANLHGSFVLVWGVFAVAGLTQLRDAPGASRWRTIGFLGATGTLLLLASVVSPNGLGTIRHVIAGVGVERVTEWSPPVARSAEGAVSIGAILLFFGFSLFRWRSLRLHDLLLIVTFSAFALRASRGIVWWAMLFPVVAPRLFASKPREEARNWGHALPVLALAGVVVACLPGIGMKTLRLRAEPSTKPSGEGAGYLNSDNPIELVRRAHAMGARRVFHDQKLGALVEFICAPDSPRPVAFVDQRMELIPEKVWQQYFALSRGEGDVIAMLTALRVDTVIAHRDEQAGLVAALNKAGFASAQAQGKYVLIRLK